MLHSAHQYRCPGLATLVIVTDTSATTMIITVLDFNICYNHQSGYHRHPDLDNHIYIYILVTPVCKVPILLKIMVLS